MRGPRASRRSARWEDCRRAGAAGTAPIAMIGIILVISLAGNSPQSHSAVARSENTVYATLAHPPVKRPAPADPSLATAQTSNGNDSNIIIEWSGFIIGSFTLLVTVLTLGTAVAALFGFSELRRARDRAAATQKQMADSLSEIEDLKSRWDSAVQEADTRVEAIVQSAYGFNQGQEAYAEGNYQRAADYFRRAHQLQPRSTAILYKLGRSYTNTGDVGKAESAFHTILEIEPTNAEAYRGLAIAHRYDDPAKALANARNAVDADPEDLKNWNCLGLMLRDDGKNAEAIEAHRRGHHGLGDGAEAMVVVADHIDLEVAIEAAPIEATVVDFARRQIYLVQWLSGEACRHRDRIFEPLGIPGIVGHTGGLGEEPIVPSKPGCRRLLQF